MPQDHRDVNPRELRLPSGRSGPDPYKLQRQIARFGASSAGMPAPWVYEGSDGVLVMYNRVTRASRIARLAQRDDPCRSRWDAATSLCRRAQDRRLCAMIQATQHELIEKLAELQQLSPDVRFGQLLANLGFLVEDQTDQSLWDVEDASLLEVIEKHRRSAAASTGRGLTFLVGFYVSLRVCVPLWGPRTAPPAGCSVFSAVEMIEANGRPAEDRGPLGVTDRAECSSSAPITSGYVPARFETGQSEPNISRSGPKSSRAAWTYGLRSDGFQWVQSASVIMPESLQ